MDTERILRILTDIENDNRSLSVSENITKIRGYFAQNNQEGYRIAAENIDVFIKEEIEKSEVYNFSRTENLMLDKIGGGDYFGRGLVEKLNEISSSKGFEVLTKMDEYVSGRNLFIAKNQKLKNDLIELGIKEYRPDDYEIAIVLPSEISTAENVHKSIKDFELLISAIQELVLGTKGEIKVTRLNNNSLDFFISQPFTVAVALTTLLSNLIIIWDRIADLNKSITETDGKNNLSDKAKEDIKVIIKKEIEAAKKEVFEKIPEKILKHAKKDLEPGRKNELANQIRIKLKAAFKWFELGIEVDIIPVRIDNAIKITVPEDIIGEEEKENYISETKQLFRKTGSSLQDFFKLPIEIRKLPFELSSGEETEKEEE